MSQAIDASRLMAETKFYESYSRFIPEQGRYETWDEAVSRVMNMHRERYAAEIEANPELEELISFAERAYWEKRILGAQRALQFGGEQLFKHNIRMYNCTSSWVDRPEFFGECMYMLLCGAGTGFSVQRHHIEKLPAVAPRTGEAVVFQIPDDIEGWATSIDVLLSSYFVNGGKHPEYAGKRVAFDTSLIRPKGAQISGGFKAPGPGPLRHSLERIEKLLTQAVAGGETQLRAIQCYDIIMHAADAVIAGGVRRSATICLFDKDDQEMMKSKTGNWFSENPQRGRSNNSAVCIRSELTREEFAEIMKSVRDFGEPGFIFTDNRDFTYNPCVEIGKYPVTQDGRSGWQGCNLTETNGAMCNTREDLLLAAKAGAILGTLQAGYTDFKFLGESAKEIFEREALIGVSITGWMNNPEVLFDDDNMRDAAHLVKRTNRQVAQLIGIRPAARTTCAKPSGNASVLLGTASGIHGEHSARYIRNVQMNKESEVAKQMFATNPIMCEESEWSQTKSDWVVSFPIEAKPGSIFKSDLLGVKQLEFVKKAQMGWVEEGTDVELCVDPNLRHNISNTIVVDDWAAVEEYVYENRWHFAGISFLGMSGDKDYVQAPFTAVLTAEEIVDTYGDAGLFASGLLVEGVEAFGNLWAGCSAAIYNTEFTDSHKDLEKRDFVRRLNKFAKNYFNGDLQKATYCLKDVYNLHRWNKITQQMQDVDWSTKLTKQEFTDVDTMGAQACAGGVCDISLSL